MKGILDQLRRRVYSMIARAVVEASYSTTTMQTVDLSTQVGHDAQRVEHFEPYGFTSRPKDGAEAVLLNLGGVDHGIAICVADRRYRLKGLDQGGVAMYDDIGQTIKLTASGITIQSSGGGDISIDADGDCTIDASGDVTVTPGAGSFVKLGGSGATDLVKTVAGTATKVKAL